MRRKTDYIAFALFIVTIHEIPKRLKYNCCYGSDQI
uniref:Uncharacterized protein n=1 Tax=Anguilla anguilla TaxID=7936 RepID=A0A0E9XKM2_ANGAN